MSRTLTPLPHVRGEIAVPPDKSISHRAAILGSLAEGESRFENFLSSADTQSTLACLRRLGADITQNGDTLAVRGTGFAGLTEPADVLNCGNSGTTMRLLSGVLAGRPFRSVLSGDESLRRRPMGRVAEPLNRMGATVTTTDAGTAPVVIVGGKLHGTSYESPVASAQVKSAVLLAAIQAEGTTRVSEPVRSRDHSERLLSAMGVKLFIDDAPQGAVTGLTGPLTGLKAIDMRIPGDISSAAAWIVAAACHPDSDLLLTGVGVNPTRRGLIVALKRMGAQVEILEERRQGGEPVADLRITSAPLTAGEFGARFVPSCIDELPLLALAATQAAGTTTISGAAELKLKESDRIASTARLLRAMGATIEPLDDGWRIEGPTRLHGAEVATEGDHRMAFLAAAAAVIAGGEVVVDDPDCATVSYPGFWDDLERLAGEAAAVAR
ncbi:MAG: 3-phosphoshikimate 1-carboxyvinyltransferase [Dehalococcoidia bacterium]